MTKRRDLIRELSAVGFTEIPGSKHAKFRKGKITVMVPRHSEIKDRLAEAIRKEAGLK